MDFNKYLSNTVQQIKPSGIRKYFDIGADAISLGIGEPDFITPMDIRQVGIDTFREGKTKYTANRGILSLRKELSHYLKSQYSLSYDPETEILITVGASEAIDLAIRAIINPGDEVLIAEPCFVSYNAIVTLTGGVPVSVVTHPENDYKVRPEDLEGVITDKTKAFILSYPNNPTGAVMTKEDLAQLVPILENKDIIIITDEIYSELTYGTEEHTSIASFPSLFEKTIYVSGFSKAYAMTGWRLGYVCANPTLMEAMLKIHQYLVMSAPTVSQYAASKAIANFYDDVIMMRAEYDVRRRYIVRRLNKVGLNCFEPRGAFYCFPSIEKTNMTCEEFCDTLLEKKRVAVVPGTAFGECGKGHVRISYAYSMDVLEKAMDRIEEFMREF